MEEEALDDDIADRLELIPMEPDPGDLPLANHFADEEWMVPEATPPAKIP